MSKSKHFSKVNPKNNQTDPELIIALGTDELWFLLQQFNPAVILGVENPYVGWLVGKVVAVANLTSKCDGHATITERHNDD